MEVQVLAKEKLMNRTYQWDPDDFKGYYAVRKLIQLLAKIKVLDTGKISYTTNHREHGKYKECSITFHE